MTIEECKQGIQELQESFDHRSQQVQELREKNKFEKDPRLVNLRLKQIQLHTERMEVTSELLSKYVKRLSELEKKLKEVEIENDERTETGKED